MAQRKGHRLPGVNVIFVCLSERGFVMSLFLSGDKESGCGIGLLVRLSCLVAVSLFHRVQVIDG